MSVRQVFTHDRYGSQAEIDIIKELQHRNLHFQYQGITELWMLYRSHRCYGHCCFVKKIHSDFQKAIRFGEEDKQYPLVGLRFLFIFLDGEEVHKGQQADRDFETDQFIKDQGSISLRYSYSGELSEARAREIVDEIEAKHREAMLA